MKWLSRILGPCRSNAELDEAVQARLLIDEDAPVSNAMAAIARGDKYGEQLFQTAFIRSEIGVVTANLPEGLESGTRINSSDYQISCHFGSDEHGNPVLIAFADPRVFEQNYGEKFAREFGLRIGATMSGIDAIRTALHHPESHGIRLNSAIADQGVVIRRDWLNSMLQVYELNLSEHNILL